ncbi:MAG: translocation/assembly module TamB domain-containing protein, partial [Planctomycetaceae bacterium]
RFDIDEASLQMEGDLIPFLRVVASTENDGITANIEIEGRADDPKVRFTSSPELPEEEVLAQLLFGSSCRLPAAVLLCALEYGSVFGEGVGLALVRIDCKRGWSNVEPRYRV